MTNTSKTILFFGTDDFSAASLRALITAGFTIGAVITKPDAPKGRGRKLAAPIVKEIAEAHGIPVWQPLRMTEITEQVEALVAETGEKPAGVLVSFGKIIPQALIDLFEPGIINVHPSLLPLYRGPSPIETALFNGDDETGVSIMQLSKAMDAGPVYRQITVPLTGTETGPSLEESLAARGAEELIKALPAILDGSLQPTEQDDAAATYCQLLSKENSLIAPNTITAAQAEQQVRAYLAFPKTKVALDEQTIVVTKAHVSQERTSDLDLPCLNGEFLAIDELVSPTGKTMPAAAFLNGYNKK